MKIDVKYLRKAMLIAIPIMIQNGITNFVSMLDNIMIGQIGTEQMSAVAIINQLMFVFNLCIFGGLSGIGIFTAQYAGKKDNDGIRYTFRLSLMLGILLTVVGTLIFFTHGNSLIQLYLHADASITDTSKTLAYALDYLQCMLWGIIAFAITQAYASVLRSCGETIAPMVSGIIAVLVNLIGNYILIFGKMGMPAMGVKGAAIATVLSRYVELGYLVLHTHSHPTTHPYVSTVYTSLHIPKGLLKQCIIKGSPLLLNEALWSSGQAVLSQNYSLRGLSVVAGLNIAQTINNVFNIGFIAMGSAIGIVIGQEIGTGRLGTVKKHANELAFFTVILCIGIGSLLFLSSGIFPGIYRTSQDIRDIATDIIRISALFMPVYAYCNASYFTIRSGGKTMITFIFDCGYTWLLSIPTAYFLINYTTLPFLTVFISVQILELIKGIISFFLIQKGFWIVNLTQ